jgi:restriction endonuclease S subunit
MSFQLPLDVDKNNIFFVKRSELNGRFDPLYFIIKIDKFISKTPFDVLKIGDCILSAKSGFGVGRQDQAEENNGILQIRPTNIIDYGILNFDRNVYVPFDLIPSNSHFLQNGDVLFNNTNSQELVGKTAIYFSHDERIMTYSNHITVLKVNAKKIKLEYLWILLNIYQENKIFFTICTNWNNQSGVGIDLLKSLKIPVPTIKEQNQIVEKMIAAYAAKKEKDTKVQWLLDGIDNYLLSELGIKKPEYEENSIQNRIFYRKFSEISGGRFDAPVYHRKFSLTSSIFPNQQLKDCIFINPPTSFNGAPSNTEATFLPMESVSEVFAEADVSQTRPINDSFGYTKFIENDLVWAKITPCMQNGKSAIVSGLTNKIGFGSTEFHVFRSKSEIEFRYIHAFLRLKYLRSFAVLFFSGSAGHQRVSENFFKKILIPIPPLVKQVEIADHITFIRNQAKTLRREAKEEFEQVRKEVEAMILGDEL